jgi:antitoxin VapB
MEEPEKKVLREMRQTFAVSSAVAPDRLAPGQTTTHRAKVFQSGNSLALRLPKALGLAAGMEMELQAAPDGGYSLKPVGMPKRKFDIDKVWGCAIGSGLQPIDEDDRWFEERPLLWDDPEWRAKHMPDI